MKKLLMALAGTLSILSMLVSTAFAVTPPLNPNDKGIGMTGTLQAPPPSDAPTITLPVDGAVFNEIPITVSGLCTDTLLVRVFKNNVFAGSAICDGGSYTIEIDLFPGLNEISARQYDDLDQASPESNKRTITYPIAVPEVPGSPDQVAQRITLTSNFARRGADPGTEMVWPFTISGGRGPFAVSIDWGDGKNDLSTQNSAGTFDAKHTYQQSGVYKVVIKATDADGVSAFLQVVAIANGAISTASEGTEPTITRTRILWQPTLVVFPLLFSSFWLGKRYQLKRVRYRMKHRIVPIDK